MPWYSKEQPTPFDTQPIAGLQFLDGDRLAQRYRQDWLAGQKYPLITFPSAISREVQPGRNDTPQPAVTIAGAFSLPYAATRDEAWNAVFPLAVERGYSLTKRGEAELTLFSHSLDRGYHVQYDNTRREIATIMRFPEYAMDLLDGESRAVLPPLYHTEHLLPEQVIAPVKFFTPDGNWTWYPTEYDGDDLFFGLVSGFEVELGLFALSELESIRGPLGLPLERDLYYTPQSLPALQQLHRPGRDHF